MNAPWYADHHCSMCRTARVGADGVFVAWGFEFCRPCAARVAEAIEAQLCVGSTGGN